MNQRFINKIEVIFSMANSSDYYGSVRDGLLHPQQAGASLPAQRAFLEDLRLALSLRENPALSGLQFAPYVYPVSGRVESNAPFPYPSASPFAQEERSAVSFQARVVDASGSASARFYGVPVILGKKVGLAESGILERRVGTVRVSENTKEDDQLLAILRELSPEFLVRAQDRDVSLSWGEVLAAYEIEGAPAFDSVVVQQAAVLIPSRSEAYQTEARILATHYGNEIEMRCFAYGIGEMLYRGRPIIKGGEMGDSAQRGLHEVNEGGKDAFFTVDRISHLSDSVGETKWGNLVVVSLPLVGERKKSTFAGISEPSPFMSFDLGASVTRGVSRGASVDYAALGIGKETGTSSKLVTGAFDTARTAAILDIRLLTITPETLERPEGLTELFS